MTVRNQNLEAVAPVMATFTIKQTDGVDDLKDANKALYDLKYGDVKGSIVLKC